ncbi:MAG: glutamate synthase subunit alpha, partial [Actinobacteria bacterium]|nr:glutamate synthase subunit alpha [Actinomycetota bacterium]
MSVQTNLPLAQGLYDPTREHDACGVAFVATLTGAGSHGVIAKALTALRNLDHRGASGSEPDSGDGAGILLQVPDTFLRANVAFELPPVGQYAVGNAFLPQTDTQVAANKSAVERIARDEGLVVLGWRTVPTDPSSVGMTAQSVMPNFEQLFLSSPQGISGLAL